MGARGEWALAGTGEVYHQRRTPEHGTGGEQSARDGGRSVRSVDGVEPCGIARSVRVAEPFRFVPGPVGAHPEGSADGEGDAARDGADEDEGAA